MFHRTAVASTTSASASVKRTLSFLKSASSPTAALNGKLAQNESVNASSVVPGNSSNNTGKDK